MNDISRLCISADKRIFHLAQIRLVTYSQNNAVFYLTPQHKGSIASRKQLKTACLCAM